MKIKFLYLFLASLLMITSCRNTDDFEEEINTLPKSKLISQNYNLYNWMSQIPNNAFVTQLSIPGTHHSGAMHEWKKLFITVKGSAKTQNLTIKEQLVYGVRYLDMKANHDMKIYHGSVDQKLQLKDVLSDIETFLRVFPTETVILCLKPENTNKYNEFDANFKKLYLQYEKMFAKSPRLPATLGSVRGKVILMKRFNSTIYDDGINAVNWGDNKTFDFLIGYSPNVVYVQDFYNPPTYTPTEATDDKKKQVELMISKSTTGSNPNSLFINYLNISMKATGVLPLIGDRDIINTKNIMNPWMVQKSKSMVRRNLGIVAFDYITETESRAIINTN